MTYLEFFKIPFEHHSQKKKKKKTIQTSPATGPIAWGPTPNARVLLPGNAYRHAAAANGTPAAVLFSLSFFFPRNLPFFSLIIIRFFPTSSSSPSSSDERRNPWSAARPSRAWAREDARHPEAARPASAFRHGRARPQHDRHAPRSALLFFLILLTSSSSEQVNSSS